MGQGVVSARSNADLAKGASSSDRGVCTAVDYAARLCTVNLGGAEQVMAWAGYAPWVGDTVVVAYLGRRPVALAQWGSPMGTVTGSDSDAITATGDDGAVYVYPYTIGYSPAPGDRVPLLHAHRHIPGEYTDEPAGSVLDTPSGPPGGMGATTFYPIDSAGWRFGNVYQGANVDASASKSGAWFYGTQLRDTLAGRTVTNLTLNLGAVVFDYFPGVDTPLGYHGESGGHGGSEPSFSGSISVTGGGSVDITSFAGAFQSGAAFGVGFAAGSGQRQFADYTRAGSISATWA